MLHGNIVSRRLILVAGAVLAAVLAIAAATPIVAQSGTKEVAASPESTIRSPQVIAVKFHADWCGFCKAMGPVMTDLQNKFDGQPALFVTLDLTNQTTRNQAEMHAAALGLGELWDANGGSTGRIYLVSAKSRTPLATLTSEQTLKDMTAALKSALQ